MGIKNFFKFLLKYCPESINYKNITDFENKRIGFDANLLIYKSVYALRGRKIELKNENIIITHIHTLFNILIKLKKYKIKSCFVFDGKPPDIKMKEILKRDTQCRILEEQHGIKQISQNEIDDCINLIKLFNFPVIFSICEADSQLAYMSSVGLIDYVASDDMDIVLFGCKKILKNFSVDIKKKIILIDVDVIKEKLKLNNNELIKIGILLGTDYNDKTMSINKVLLHKNDILDNKNKIIYDYYKNPPNIILNNIDFNYNIAKKKYFLNFFEKFKLNNDYSDKLFNLNL